MSNLKEVHLEHPTATVWHNVADTLTGDTTEFKDNWLCEWNNSYNYGGDDELWLGYHTTYGGYDNGFLWWDMPVDTSYRLVSCSLAFVVSYDGVFDDTLVILPCDTTINSGYGTHATVISWRTSAQWVAPGRSKGSAPTANTSSPESPPASRSLR